MINTLAQTGARCLLVCQLIGRSGVFLINILGWGKGFKAPCHRVIKQIHHVGVLSLPIIVVAGIFVGMVLALQGYSILSSYGSQEAIGQMVALSLLREFGPLSLRFYLLGEQAQP